MYLKKKEREILLEAETNFAEWFKDKEEATRNQDEDYHGADHLDECMELFREYLVVRGLLEKRTDF
ncbi:hypothetical protein ABEY30_18135 [Bacillus pacificus]|uniref:hypothetical protein n=1 Tax=Bacillus cereus group TaxID=86661 RepID=UPI0008FD9B49|nr:MULTISPECIES: hypothetical protein [Bacillus cereus group]AXO92819.1 hypothetical protein DY471_10515 [Bacillus anthracis]MDA1795680.1 hypothetical protein [Bacillus cereus group sp. BY8-1LC]OJD85898.1 hypothetical protein MCCC1A01412_22535 [Bacillus anthracis]PGU60321.1 hypothetical protein COD72_00080 [Bacillus cereus]